MLGLTAVLLDQYRDGLREAAVSGNVGGLLLPLLHRGVCEDPLVLHLLLVR